MKHLWAAILLSLGVLTAAHGADVQLTVSNGVQTLPPQTVTIDLAQAPDAQSWVWANGTLDVSSLAGPYGITAKGNLPLAYGAVEWLSVSGLAGLPTAVPMLSESALAWLALVFGALAARHLRRRGRYPGVGVAWITALALLIGLMPSGQIPAHAQTITTNPDGSITVISNDGQEKFIVRMSGNTLIWRYGVYVNTPPVPTFEGATYQASLNMNATGQLTATDANPGDTLTFSVVSAPSAGHFSVSPNGSYTLTGAVMPGTYPFTYAVSDGHTTVNKTATITVTDVPLVAAGAFASLGSVTIGDNIGLPLPTPIEVWWVTDLLGRPVVYVVTGLPAGFSYNMNTGTIGGKRDANGTENYSITVRAYVVGNDANALQKTFTLTIQDEG